MSDFAILAYYKRGGATKDGGNAIQDVFWMDATVSIAPSRKASVTKHPTEDRANISDHVILDNALIDVVGHVSNAPITQVQGNVIPQSANRVQDAYTSITELYNERRPVTVIAELETFENCILTSLSIPQDAQNAEAIKIEMKFEQIRIASTSSEVNVVAYNTTKGRIDGKPNEDGGNKSTFRQTTEKYSPALSALLYAPSDIVTQTR